MPIYEYTCESCKARFEQLVKSMSSREAIRCPKCGTAGAKRSLSVFAVGGEAGKSSAATEPGMCGRCGGPGPCGMN
jgi:putative FmdB family regulatory protein